MSFLSIKKHIINVFSFFNLGQRLRKSAQSQITYSLLSASLVLVKHYAGDSSWLSV